MNPICGSTLLLLVFLGSDPPANLGAQTSVIHSTIQKSADGVSYLSTGIGYDSRVNLPPFSLKLVFSTRSRAYLAEIDVEIIPGPSGKPTQIHSHGPWLLVDLPPGKYRVNAKTSKGEVVGKAFAIVAGRVTSLQLRWNISDEDI
jgi:hypothetical protein